MAVRLCRQTTQIIAGVSFRTGHAFYTSINKPKPFDSRQIYFLLEADSSHLLRACLDAALLPVLLAPKPLGEVTGGGGLT